jgi:hypothetical protein
MIVEMEDKIERMRRRMELLDRDFRKAQTRMLEEMERLRSQSRRGDIVPLSSVRRVQIQVERAKRSSGPRREGPIAVGPGSN